MKKAALLLIALVSLSQVLLTAQTREKYTLKVGAAKVDITPPSEPTAPAVGKYDHERAFIRAIVLDNGETRAAMISIEGFLDDYSWAELLQQIKTELNCPVENIVITTTHSHSTGMPSFPKPGEKVTKVSAFNAKILGIIREAKANLEPAVMGYGKGVSYLNVNRNVIEKDTRKWTQAANMEGTSDKSVDVLMFTRPSGEPIAVFYNYAMHPVNGYVVGVFSADFPGAASRYVEKTFGPKMVAAFSQGASGDQNPLYLRASTNAMASRGGVEISGFEMKREPIEAPLRSNPKPPLVDPQVLDNLMRMIESEGQLLGEEVIRTMTNITKTTGDIRIKGIQRTYTCPGRTRINYDFSDNSRREGVEGEYVDGPDVNHHLGVLGLGTAVIATTDGEIFSYIGLKTKEESPLTNTMFVELANGGQGRGPGYVPEDAAYGQQTFQVLNAPDKEGCAERTIINGFYDLVTEYLTEL
jgi:hypothetical protein